MFTRCKKLKKLTIKSRTITKIGKNKFPKKCKIVVPQAMKKKYTRLLKKDDVYDEKNEKKYN